MSDIIYPKESVYNIIPREETPTSKPPRYVSKFRPTVLQENNSKKDLRRTMGPSEVEVPSPGQYLKKHSKEPKLPEKDVHKSCTCTAKKPQVPARTDNPPIIRTKRDFLKTVECGVPKKPQPVSVDSHKGHKQHLETSGLVPKYIKKKDFGKIPEYLQQRSEEERRAQEEYDDFVREQREQNAMKHLSDEERQAVLKGLKSNWDKLHHEYQGLSLIIDTPSKKAHKQRLEEAMEELKTDIDLLQRFKTIYISQH
ncbi:enkurin isoform X2 [Salarias fasciatus]|uniref:Enkurin domain-containing protein n=1 Tax=Salarias fasciatus TaxID=181472 RepID=A0A672H170_SALFA|nr:enkurin isoform X2 [Salarias fasciatus]